MKDKVALYFVNHLPDTLLQKITLMYLGNLISRSPFGEEIVSEVTIGQVIVAMKEREFYGK